MHILFPLTDEIPRKKCTVFPFHPSDQNKREGIVLWVLQSIEELVKAAKKHLKCHDASCILSENGCKILDVTMISNNEKLFLVGEAQSEVHNVLRDQWTKH